MRYLISIILILFILSPGAVMARTYRGVVEHVIDGDTVVINGTKVRLIGIDTPETKHPDKPRQCFGAKSYEYAKARLEGKSVKYITDEKYEVHDKYGRLLAYIYDKEGFFNADMVKSGYAFAYKRFPFKYKKRFIRYEKRARKKSLGLWGACIVSCKKNKCETNTEKY